MTLFPEDLLTNEVTLLDLAFGKLDESVLYFSVKVGRFELLLSDLSVADSGLRATFGSVSIFVLFALRRGFDSSKTSSF